MTDCTRRRAEREPTWRRPPGCAHVCGGCAQHLPWQAPTTADVAKRRVQLSLGVLLALLAAVLATGLIAAFSLYHSAESRYVDVVFPLRTATRDLVLGMVDEEAGIRGYMITSDRQSLALYFRGRKSVEADLAQIAELTRGQPELSTRLQALRTEVRGLHGYYARLIALIADRGLSPAEARARLLDDASAFTRFRHTADLLQNDLDAFVESTRVSQRTTFYRAVGTLGIAGLLGLAIAGALLLGVPERLRLLYLGEERARRRAEQGANAARALEHVSDAVVLIDDGGHVRLWNPGAERLFGVDGGGAVGRPAVEVVPGFARLAEGGEELVAVPLEGEERWFAPSASRFDGGIVLTVRDVTTAHLLERARTEFVATASHELRTPLTSIYGAAQTLLGREGLSEEVRHELMRIIGSESVHLARIVDQLLVTAQLTRGRLTLNETDCDVRALCADVLAVAETRLPAGATLALTAPPVVRAVPLRRGAAAAGAREPRRQRAQVLAGRRPGRDPSRGRPRPAADRGARRGARDRPVGAGADLREVLPPRRGDDPRRRRLRARPAHHARDRRADGRHDLRPLGPGRGLDVHAQPAARLTVGPVMLSLRRCLAPSAAAVTLS